MSERPTGKAVLKFEDDQLRITEWRFAPGEATGWHRHEYPYVVVPLGDGRLGLDNADKTYTTATLDRGMPMAARRAWSMTSSISTISSSPSWKSSSKGRAARPPSSRSDARSLRA